jgi:hypothetical protein
VADKCEKGCHYFAYITWDSATVSIPAQQFTNVPSKFRSTSCLNASLPSEMSSVCPVDCIFAPIWSIGWNRWLLRWVCVPSLHKVPEGSRGASYLSVWACHLWNSLADFKEIWCSGSTLNLSGWICRRRVKKSALLVRLWDPSISAVSGRARLWMRRHQGCHGPYPFWTRVTPCHTPLMAAN